MLLLPFVRGVRKASERGGKSPRSHQLLCGLSDLLVESQTPQKEMLLALYAQILCVVLPVHVTWTHPVLGI